MSGLGGQGAVTASHILAMAANNAGLYSISNPFFGAESTIRNQAYGNKKWIPGLRSASPGMTW